MVNQQDAGASFNSFIQEARRKKNEEAAQEMLGKNPQKAFQEMLSNKRRQSAPTAPARKGPSSSGPLMSLASRAGVSKRNSSLPRTNEPRPRNPRQPSHLSRPPVDDNYRPAPRTPAPAPPSSDTVSNAKSNGFAARGAANGSSELNIRGASVKTYTVVAQNFAPGTTAADIESVMQGVSGDVLSCRLIASDPTVIAEMAFPSRDGADSVVATFNNKRADGRLLHVYLKEEDGSVPGTKLNTRTPRPAPAAQPEPITPAVGAADESMEIDEIDENAESREAQNRIREERRGRDSARDTRERPEAFPTGPRNDRRYDSGPGYYSDRRGAEPAYQDGRYGFERGGGYGGRGRYRNEGGMYSDGMGGRRGGGGGQSWRP